MRGAEKKRSVEILFGLFFLLLQSRSYKNTYHKNNYGFSTTNH